ncbi:hypothetical protein [Dyadobacter sp. LHD-138]|uniref:hypothetical protein n=1 Tax=Dyadobacter sp. LHD-138 TaxID=3071413 RepID=UPI0027E08685|nr:hypothetical protein [Dyadobacter sp. LHD-138]MDQ6482235.1 hypothetical protein [Dyadobacter sp. LHD-138]
MKKLLLLLLLLSAGVQAQVTSGKDTLATQSWVRKFFNPGGVIVDPGAPKCEKHPTIDAIFDVTATTAKVRFDAVGLTEFQLSFQATDGKEITYQRFKDPKSNTVQITFAKQPIGTYQVELIPISCKSEKKNDVKQFRLTDGGESPPASDCKPYSIAEIKNISNVGITVKFAATGLTKLTLTLLSSSDAPIKSITYEPKQDELYFPFNVGSSTILPSGNYKIRLTPVSCNGQPTVEPFTIKANESGEATPPDENAGIPKFSQTPKKLFQLKNSAGTYEDITPGDYIGSDGTRYRKEGGIIYKALYWINELALVKDGRPVDFGKRVFPNGVLGYVRKEYAAFDWSGIDNKNSSIVGKPMPWRGSIDQESFLSSGWDIWLHSTENKDAVSDYLFRTVTANFTTNGGKDLKTGNDFIRQQNSAYMDAGNLVPQFIYNPTKKRSDKPVVIQCYPTLDSPYETVKGLYDGGVTHVWWQNLHNGGIYVDGRQAVATDKYPLTPGFNWSSTEFKLRFPRLNPGDQLTDDECIEFANNIYLGNNFILTDEWSEGSYPQMSDRRNIIYKRVGERIKEMGLVGVQLLGDYGYGSKNLHFRNSSVGEKPMDKYYLGLLGPDGKEKLEQVGGSGHTTVKNDYWQNGQSNYRGTVVGAYYAITAQSPDLIPAMTYEAMLFNNMFPDQPKQRFTTPIMQSNAHGADVPYKNDGTTKADGTENLNQYPEAPAELLKINSFKSLLFYNSAYLWDAWGTKPAREKNAWYDSSIMFDGWIEGTRWYANMVPYLNEAGRRIIVSDYSSSGKEFRSSTIERHVSNSGTTHFYNSYFNEVANNKVGELTFVPSKKKVFVYINSYKMPSEIEEITAHVDGKDYYLGECAGSTLNVFYEK